MERALEEGTLVDDVVEEVEATDPFLSCLFPSPPSAGGGGGAAKGSWGDLAASEIN